MDRTINTYQNMKLPVQPITYTYNFSGLFKYILPIHNLNNHDRAVAHILILQIRILKFLVCFLNGMHITYGIKK